MCVEISNAKAGFLVTALERFPTSILFWTHLSVHGTSVACSYSGSSSVVEFRNISLEYKFPSFNPSSFHITVCLCPPALSV